MAAELPLMVGTMSSKWHQRLLWEPRALAAKVVTMMLKALGMTRERILGIGTSNSG